MKIIFFLFLISIITTHKIENLFLNNEVKNIINQESIIIKQTINIGLFGYENIINEENLQQMLYHIISEYIPTIFHSNKEHSDLFKYKFDFNVF